MLCNKEKFVNLEKTSDELLECVVAGSKRLCKKVRFAGIVATIFSVPISFGCMVAGKICKEKAKTQKQQGNAVKAQNLKEASKVLNNMAIGFGGVASAGEITFLGASIVGATLYE